MGDIHLSELPGKIATVKSAPADTAKSLFVDTTGAICALGKKAYGVNKYTVSLGDHMAIGLDGELIVAAGGTIAAGDLVTSNAVGKAIKRLDERRKFLKSADEDKISTTTYADDAVLKDVEVEASKTYQLKARLLVKNAHASAQSIKYKFILPASATLVGSIKAADKIGEDLLLIDDNANLATEQVFQVAAPATSTTTETAIIEIDAVLTISTTAGNVDLQWAPNASVAGNLTMLTNSYLEVIDDEPYEINGMAVTAGTSGSDMLVKVPV
jgi:hypothetical protein